MKNILISIFLASVLLVVIISQTSNPPKAVAVVDADEQGDESEGIQHKSDAVESYEPKDDSEVQPALGSEIDEYGTKSQAGLDVVSFRTFNIEIPPSGAFVDVIEFSSTSQMDMGMGTEVAVTEMAIESERIVSDLFEGGKSVDTTVSSLSFSMKTSGMMQSEVNCNSEEQSKAAVEEVSTEFVDSDMCGFLMGLLGENQHYVIDDEGNIAEASGPGAEVMAALDGNEGLTIPNHLEETSRLLQMLPTVPVRIGDSWDSSVDFGDLGEFAGKSTLVGPVEYEGRNCDEIHSEGTLALDMNELAAKLGDAFSGLLKGVDMSLSDGKFVSTVYWDNQALFTRWAKLTFSFELTISDPGKQFTLISKSNEVMTLSTSEKSHD